MCLGREADEIVYCVDTDTGIVRERKDTTPPSLDLFCSSKETKMTPKSVHIMRLLRVCARKHIVRENMANYRRRRVGQDASVAIALFILLCIVSQKKYSQPS